MPVKSLKEMSLKSEKTRRSLVRIVTYFVLITALIFVQLPLIWMIITALKQPGQAFKLRFWPVTKLTTLPIEVKPMEGMEPVAIFEYIDKTAQRVNLAGEMNSWNKDDLPMSGVEGVWTIRLDDVEPGKYEYKFVVNGDRWIQDPANPKTANDNSIIEVDPEGISTNKPLTNQTYYKDGILNIKIKDEPDVKQLAIIKPSGKSLDLKKEGEYWIGRFKWETPEGQDPGIRYRLVKTRSFGKAFNALYTLENFKKIIYNEDFPFLIYFLNSLVVASLAGVITVLLCTMAGYAFAKKDFIGREKLFAGLLSAMLIPGMIYMVPQFAIVLKLGWINSYQGMVIPHVANVFGLFLLRQHIKTIPDSLFQAARIDGAGEFHVFTTIVLPLSLPIMVTLFLLTFVGQWSNFLWQLIINTPDSPFITLPVGLQLFKGQYAQDWEPIMAGACFSIIPIAILFLFAQRYFIEGMTIGAVKE